LIAPKNRQVQKHQWDRQSLNQKEKISKYQEYLQLMLQEIKEKTDTKSRLAEYKTDYIRRRDRISIS
jgi:hypothetical protein